MVLSGQIHPPAVIILVKYLIGSRVDPRARRGVSQKRKSLLSVLGNELLLLGYLFSTGNCIFRLFYSVIKSAA